MSAIVFKPIKPARFEDKAFVNEFKIEARSVRDDMMKEYHKTTRTWKSKPKFTSIVQVGPAEVSVLVGTDDQVYQWVDEGTKGPYQIPKQPRPGRWLKFKTKFVSKTRPRWLGSRKGSKSPPWAMKRMVMHPGITAREFSQEIEKIYRPRFRGRMEAAIRRAGKASGHGG